MHAANRRAWDEAAERYEGWFDEAVELISSGWHEPASSRAGAHRRPARAMPAGDPPAVRRRSRHALALEPGRGRGRRRRLQPAHARRWRARLSTAVGAPARWIEADVLDTPHELDGTADLVYTGRGSLMWLQDLDAWAAVLYRLLAPGGRLVLFEGHPAEWLFDVDADGGWVATDYDYFAGPEASKGWAPEYIDQLSIDDDDQHWKFARAWTLGRDRDGHPRAPGLTVERVAEHPTDWWNGHADVRDDERGRIPLSFSVLARRTTSRSGRSGRAVDRDPGAVERQLDDRRALLDQRLAEGRLEVGVALDAHAAGAHRAADAPRSRPAPSSVATPSPVPRSSCHIRIVPYRSLSNTSDDDPGVFAVGGLELGHGHGHAAVADEGDHGPVAMDQRRGDRPPGRRSPSRPTSVRGTCRACGTGSRDRPSRRSCRHRS